MNLDNLANIATIIEAVLVVVSVVFIWYELRQSRKLTQASNVQSVVELSSPFNLELVKDREMADFWVHGAEKYELMDSVDQYRYKSLLIWWLILHENIFYQWHEGLISDNYYHGWQGDLDDFVKLHKIWVFWPEFNKHYQKDFSDHVSTTCDKFQSQDYTDDSE